MVAIFGVNLGPATPAGLQLDASGSVATTLAGTQVLFDGVASPLIFASAGQICWNRFTGPGKIALQTMYVHMQGGE